MKLAPLCRGALTVIDENEPDRSWLELEHEDDLDEELEQELEPKLDDSRF